MKQKQLFQRNHTQFHQFDNGNYFACLKSYSRVNDLHCILDLYFDWALSNERSFTNSHAIVIKPNITSGEEYTRGKTTNPNVLIALITWLLAHDVTPDRIIVCDSSVIGVDTIASAKKAGIIDVCNRFGISFLDLRLGPFCQIQVKNPFLHSKLDIHELFADENVFKINLAKIKTTYGSPVGLCIKNLKGIITDDLKLDFHIKGVQQSLVDLNSICSCDLNILEGFPASQLGEPISCDLYAVSSSDLLVDCIVSEIIGVRVKLVSHLDIQLRRHADRLKLQKIIDNFIEIVEFHHQLKYTNNGLKTLSDEFGILIADGKPCSSCIESFYKAALKLRDSNSPLSDALYVFGPWQVDNFLSISNESDKIMVGTCALAHYNTNSDSLLGGGIEIPGCPPTIDLIEKELRNSRKYLKNVGEDGDDYLQRFKKVQYSRLIYDWIYVSPVAAKATSIGIPAIVQLAPAEEVKFNGLGHELALQCELITAAICNQMNWDFLRSRIYERALADAEAWDFNKIKNITASELSDLLAGYHKPERINANQRAEMLRDLSKLRLFEYDSFHEIITKSCSHIGGPEGILNTLKKCSVFSQDPEMKKIQVLIHSLVRNGLVDFQDIGLIDPAVDYHLMRSYVRRGIITARNKQGEKYLLGNVKRKSITTNSIRSLVASAMRDICRYSGCNIVEVNGADWWFGRTVCKREQPDCNLTDSSSKWLRDKFEQCPFLHSCLAYNYFNELIFVVEPREDSKYY